MLAVYHRACLLIMHSASVSLSSKGSVVVQQCEVLSCVAANAQFLGKHVVSEDQVCTVLSVSW